MYIGNGAIVAIIIGGLGALLAARYLGSTGTSDPLEERINKLLEALNYSSTLINEIEEEIFIRKEFVKNLKTDAEKAKQIASLSKEQADAISREIQIQLEKEGRKSFWKSAALNFGFFIAGAIVSYLLSQPIN